MARDTGAGTHNSYGALPPSVLEERTDEETETGEPQAITTDAFATSDPSELLAAGECPWCDEYDGDHPNQHASSAHPDEWGEYTDDRSE